MEIKNLLSTKKLLMVGVGIVAIVLLAFSPKLIENVDNSEIVIIQGLSGDVRVYDQPGPVLQLFGTATHYKKSNQYWFSKHEDEGTSSDQSVKIRFNDGGHATISGSIRWFMPIDHKSILKLHTDYRSQSGVEQELIRQVVTKSIYMAGPLMSSKESAAEKRNDLLTYIEDQSILGVYKTKQIDITEHDELTNTDKVITVVRIVQDDKGQPVRLDKSIIIKYNLTLNNLALNSIDYSPDVERQIKTQQDLVMSVQTSIANAKKSVQDAITVEQQGKAKAMSAKWDQEVIKAKLMTEATQKKEVAELDAQTSLALARKIKTDADAESYKNARMVAAGLTPQERAEYEMKTKVGVAEALSKISLPSTYITGSNSNGNASMLESILGVKLLDYNKPTK